MNILYLGRGPIAERCLRHCHPALTVMNATEHVEAQLLEQTGRLGLDTMVSVQYQWILSSRLLHAVNHAAYNLHNAKLPDYRGHNCIHWALRNGDTVYHSTIHKMVGAVDRGDIVCEAETPVLPDDTAESLYWRTVDACETMFVAFMAMLQRGEIRGRPQGEGGRFYSKFLPIPQAGR